MDETKKQILIVEDEVLVGWTLDNVLKKSGYHVTIVDSAEKALELLKTTVYDLIITDFKLPKINGFDMAATLRTSHSLTPIIMMSTEQDQDFQSGLPNNIISHFIEKPFDIAELLNTISTLFNKKNSIAPRV
jgi:DNA-binding response OmpR family regulator